MKKKKAFTLAEVLITLGIIGVVAAMTLPALLHKFKMKELSNQLKTSYSILSQGFGKILADDGVTNFEDTQVYAKLVATSYDNTYIAETFKKYFKTVVHVSYEQQVAEGWPSGNQVLTGDICNKFVGKGSTWWGKGHTKCIGLRQQVLRLANGAVLRTGFFDYPEAKNKGRIQRVHAEMTIDVNGEKEPNTFGEDAFLFVLAQDGKVYPVGGMDYSLYYAARNGVDYKDYYYLDDKDYCKEGNGKVCAGAVMEHNWKIDY